MSLTRLTAVRTGLLLLLLVVGPVAEAPGEAESGTVRRATADEAKVLVTVRGVGLCSGAPIEGTRMVVTAAHCLLDPRTGRVSVRHDLRVEHDAVRYDIDTIIIDQSSSLGAVLPERDAAILLLGRKIPGPGVVLPGGVVSPTTPVLLLGYQPIGPDGEFHRGRDYHTRLSPDGSSTGAVYTGRLVAACDADIVFHRTGYYVYPCGMVPGGSGGPVLTLRGRRLLGIISSVNRSLTHNGVTPVEEIARLLLHADRFAVVDRGRHDVTSPEDSHAGNDRGVR